MSDVTLSEDMLVSAVRYALGRSTYIVGVTVDQVIRVWPELSERARSVIWRDVRESMSRNVISAIDHADWQRLVDHIKESADD